MDADMKRFAPLCLLLALTITSVNSFKDEQDTKESGIPEIGYQGTLFSQPGLVWIDFDPETVESELRYTPLLQDTWLTREVEILTINMGIGKASNFTHLALDFNNRTLILADQLNRRIVNMTNLCTRSYSLERQSMSMESPLTGLQMLYTGQTLPMIQL
ncbi:hypothetical protein CHS0354_003025 [Potamilus streckersoni]|uniref:Uncharacterized protein n=1 Tax=Potamilus streckersoni TaxID=2493646 RepID=A0AAE0W3L5_9BIVA|nr:hypothetical protein CHS0354_003025 [Potamilus streckersoni]